MRPCHDPPGEAVGRFGTSKRAARADGPFALLGLGSASRPGGHAQFRRRPGNAGAGRGPARGGGRHAWTTPISCGCSKPESTAVGRIGDGVLASASIIASRQAQRWQLAVDLAANSPRPWPTPTIAGRSTGAEARRGVGHPDGQARLAVSGVPSTRKRSMTNGLGFAGYLASEQAGGAGAVGRNTDVYGLGGSCTRC